MRLKGNTLATAATYAYTDPLKPDHAPSALTTGGVTTTFTYDANGNMLTGLGGKVMEYDGENRPLSVTYLGKKTCYVYGADGKRLKKVEGLAPATLCTALPPAANVTTYFGPVEVRNWLGAEQVLTYPQPSIKLTNGVATWLHFDQLGSVRAITDAAGVKVESAIYRPFGEQSEWLLPGNVSPETKGWIGERYDADAGLQYLNARYYDPALSLFLQPDWFEVTKPGVGTNRFSYSFNDPVNKFDPGGNASYQMSRDLDSDVVVGAHSTTVIITDDKTKYPDYMQDLFRMSVNMSGLIPGISTGDEFQYITISGQNSDNNSEYPEYGEGKLVGVVNDKADVAAMEELSSGEDSVGSYNAALYDRLDDGDPATSDTDMDTEIFKAYLSYDNDLAYSLFGPSYSSSARGPKGQVSTPQEVVGHNCHGFAMGLALKAGATNYTEDVFGYDPGNGIPIPLGAFDRILGGP